MTGRHRRAAIAASLGVAFLAGTAALPHGTVIRNTSASMGLGWYIRVPFAVPQPGDVVVFPVPERARAMAERAGIAAPLMKRVRERSAAGDLLLAGDDGGAASLDSRYYGAVPERDILGVYRLLIRTDPGPGRVPPDKAPDPGAGGSISEFTRIGNGFAEPEPSRVPPRGTRGRSRSGEEK